MSDFRFEVRTGDNGTDRDGWLVVQSFDNGKAAADYVSGLKSMGHAGSLAIVRVPVAAPVEDAGTKWRAREFFRFWSGDYKTLPIDPYWLGFVCNAYPSHFAHVSQSSSSKIAFTESDKAGEADRQKVLTAAEYFERFFSGAVYSPESDTTPYLTQSTRQECIGSMLGESCNLLFAPMGDADRLEELYNEMHGGSLSSCMTHSASRYCSPFHPVRVYAMGGDLTLAYVRNDPDGADDDTNPIVARAMVWPDKRQYGRVYETQGMGVVFRKALALQGYSSGCMNGAKVACVEHNGQVVMPYLDIGGGTFGGSIDDDYLYLGGEYCGGSQSGLADIEERSTCENCDDTVRSDDMSEVLTSRHGSEMWCEHCVDSSAFTCETLGQSVADRRATSYYHGGSRYTVASWVADDIGLIYVDSEYEYYHPDDVAHCPDCDSYFCDYDMREQVNVDGDTDLVCASCAESRQEAIEDAEADAAQAALEAGQAAGHPDGYSFDFAPVASIAA